MVIDRHDRSMTLYSSVWAASGYHHTALNRYMVTADWIMLYLADYLRINPKDERALDMYVDTPLTVRNLLTEDDIEYENGMHFCLSCGEPLYAVAGVVSGEMGYTWIGNLVITAKCNEQWPNDADTFQRFMEPVKQTYYMSSGGYMLYPMSVMRSRSNLYYHQTQ